MMRCSFVIDRTTKTAYVFARVGAMTAGASRESSRLFASSRLSRLLPPAPLLLLLLLLARLPSRRTPVSGVVRSGLIVLERDRGRPGILRGRAPPLRGVRRAVHLRRAEDGALLFPKDVKHRRSRPRVFPHLALARPTRVVHLDRPRRGRHRVESPRRRLQPPPKRGFGTRALERAIKIDEYRALAVFPLGVFARIGEGKRRGEESGARRKSVRSVWGYGERPAREDARDARRARVGLASVSSYHVFRWIIATPRTVCVRRFHDIRYHHSRKAPTERKKGNGEPGSENGESGSQETASRAQETAGRASIDRRSLTVSTPSLPPSSIASIAARAPRLNSSNSWLRCILSAWNASFAGCMA